jgi:wobble nucleotide-excising tRNase
VVDDPVSSLDAGALNYAFNLLKNTLQNAEQLIILTHNINFMNECRKWLKSMGKTKRSLFYVHSWIDNQPGRRKASIREMPVLLSEYDSEYQYLFSLVKLCAEEGVESENVPGHLMPNVIRRVLELFLAFKIPNGKKLKQKIEDPAVEGAGLGVSRMKAIHRLADVESHSDNIEGLIGFSSLAIEETEGAAQAVLNLIEVMDKNHFQHLAELSE